MLQLRLATKYTPRNAAFHHRLYSTHRPSPLNPNNFIYVSNSTNPYFNLSLEDWLFRHKNPKEPLLLLYRDSPCVVIGRNQNPWKEVNLSASRQTGIPFIRRRSGGGTVYHDLGNTNFSLHLPRTTFDRHETAQTVLKAVRSLGIEAAHVNERNDLCVGGYKVSGSAYKIVNNRAYHHGTMLISSRLDTLGDLLRVDKETMHTKGIASVRSPVRNLQHFKEDVTHEQFVKAVVKHFRLDYDIEVDEEVHYVEENELANSIGYIRRGMDELKTWDWAYGQTPEFTYTIEKSFGWGTVTAEVKAKHGLILGCSLRCLEGDETWSDSVAKIEDWLVGKKYGFLLEEMQRYGGWSVGGDLRAIVLRNWLVEALSD